MAVVCAPTATCMVGSDGTLYRFSGLCVQPAHAGSVEPMNFAPVLQIATYGDAARAHTAAVSRDGMLYVWGHGCIFLGHGSQLVASDAPRAFPRHAFGVGARVSGVSCGQSFIVAVTDRGGVFTIGRHAHGQLGIGQRTADDARVTTTPTRVETLVGTHIVMVAAGVSHTVAVCTAGHVWAWGSDFRGQLGLGPAYAYANARERVVSTPAQLAGFGVDRDKTAVFVSAAGCHSAVVTREGRMFAFGLNMDGQLGHSRFGRTCSSPVEMHAPTLHQVSDAAPAAPGRASPKRGVGGAGADAAEIVTTAYCTARHTVATTNYGALWVYGPALGRPSVGPGQEFGSSVRIHEDHFGADTITTVCLTRANELLAVTEHGQVYMWDGAMSTAPVVLDRQFFGLGHVGPYARLPPSHALAFAMSTQDRLGNNGCVLARMPGELVKRIVEACGAPPRVQTEGHRRQLGGYAACV